MAQVILDFSGGNTHKNDIKYLKRMIDELKAVDTGKHEVIIKHQLFQQAGDNIPLDYDVFDWAYDYAKKLNYQTTASVFDKKSLNFLLQYDPIFVKIANNRKLYWLIGKVPREVRVYVSCNSKEYMRYDTNCAYFSCISKYPALIEDYELTYTNKSWFKNISDHTIGLELFKKYQPQIWEKHYRLSDSEGLDAGPFAITPEELAEIL